ncbi:thiamine pyrophosphate-dependent enzyme [Microbulbifer sp. VAAC004]|uniref:thiamine pyrophosphate-dependent enzyme n=1 Tax=unclassified Microbulbifer TaxID=2619833 RepID=UPI004039A859
MPNRLAIMSYALPDATDINLVHPKCRVLAVMGDSSFMMNFQEVETAISESIPIIMLIFVGSSYGLFR